MSSGSASGLGAESYAISGTGVWARAGAEPSAAAVSKSGKRHFIESSSTRILLLWFSAGDGLGSLRLQDQLLDAPGFDLADHDLVRVAAIHHVHDLEAAELLAGMAEPAEDRAVQLHLVDLAGDGPASRPVAVRVGVGGEQILMRALRHAHRPADPDIVVDGLGLEVVVEHLVTEVGAVGDVDVALGVDLEPVRQVELARLLSGLLAAHLG